MYGAILTYYGAAIYVNTKSIRVTNDSSMKNEGYGTQKVADIAPRRCGGGLEDKHPAAPPRKGVQPRQLPLGA